jgi:hypothetical protein
VGCPLTQINWESAKKIYEIDKAKDIVKKGFPIRTTAEELGKLLKTVSDSTNTPSVELEKKLKTAVGAQNFSNWWNGKVSISRQGAIKISFTLGLGVIDAQRFVVQSCWHEGLYIRDYKDLIYMFFLEKKLDFADAEQMIKKHSVLDTQNPDVEIAMPLGSGRITEILERQFEKSVHTVDDLDAFLEKNASRFGSFRRKAHEKFSKMYDIVKGANEIDSPTDNEICQMVLMNIPSLRAFGGITNEILVKIAENTLPRSGLSEIINKTPDSKTGKIAQANRKHLILMWLLIYGGRPAFEDSEEAETAFEECIEVINFDLLEPCGFPTLDPRNPFDWLIINALYYCHFAKDDEDADAVERIRLVIGELFNGGDGGVTPQTE